MPMSATRRLPLFPLNLVLYPSERLPLHIFEPRYKEMVAYCLDAEQPFGIVMAAEEGIAEVGCSARIERIIRRYEDGRMDILAVGEERFRVQQLYQDEPYLSADVDPIEEPEEPSERSLQERLITQHMRLLELAGRTVRPSLYQDVPALSFAIAPNAGLSPQQKQELLETLTENDRLQYLVNHLESLIPRVEEVEDVRRRIQSNGHFKDFPPEV